MPTKLPTIAALLLCLAACGAPTIGSPRAADSCRGAACTATPDPRPIANPAATPMPSPDIAPAGPASSFGDGTWAVGPDIVPGTYRSAGAKPGLFEFCSVSTHTGDAGDGSVVDWQTANAGEPVRIRVSRGSVQASGCEKFTKV